MRVVSSSIENVPPASKYVQGLHIAALAEKRPFFAALHPESEVLEVMESGRPLHGSHVAFEKTALALRTVRKTFAAQNGIADSALLVAAGTRYPGIWARELSLCLIPSSDDPNHQLPALVVSRQGRTTLDPA